jgi:hypothetical protein
VPAGREGVLSGSKVGQTGGSRPSRSATPRRDLGRSALRYRGIPL